jgi:hypothetical protein
VLDAVACLEAIAALLGHNDLSMTMVDARIPERTAGVDSGRVLGVLSIRTAERRGRFGTRRRQRAGTVPPGLGAAGRRAM